LDLQLLLAKKEVTYGVDPVATTANTILAEEPTFALQGETVTPDPAKPGVGPVASKSYGRRVNYGFKVPLVGSGIAGTAPLWGPLMKACGWTETVVAATSVTYALMSNPKLADSMTLTWRDGNRRKHVIKGWRGRVGLDLTAGKRPMLVFNGIGLHTVVATAGAELAQADADFTGWLDALPVASGTTAMTLGGVSNLGIRALNFDQSDNVKFVDLPGLNSVRLLGPRKFTGKVQITNPLPSVLNLEQLWVDGTVQTYSMVHDVTAGRIAAVNGRFQLFDPSYDRQDGDDVASANTLLVPSTLSTDDDLSIVLT
jgi:hypothetical protein